VALAKTAKAFEVPTLLIPTCIDYDRRAHVRRPIVMMCQG
jgi:hypothetical protein